MNVLLKNIDDNMTHSCHDSLYIIGEKGGFNDGRIKMRYFMWRM